MKNGLKINHNEVRKEKEIKMKKEKKCLKKAQTTIEIEKKALALSYLLEDLNHARNTSSSTLN